MPIDDDENPKLLQFIASTVEAIRDRVTGIESRMGALESRMGGLENRMGALEDRVGAVEGRIGAVEDRIGAVENRLSGIEQRQGSLDNRMEAGFTAVRGDVERVHLRLDSIEKMMSVRLERVENEVSRLRSVVYLLAKDRPELLRLLGEPSVS
jgi:predicted  nucleic acid-binding Zn-ribbon protein